QGAVNLQCLHCFDSCRALRSSGRISGGDLNELPIARSLFASHQRGVCIPDRIGEQASATARPLSASFALIGRQKYLKGSPWVILRVKLPRCPETQQRLMTSVALKKRRHLSLAGSVKFLATAMSVSPACASFAEAAMAVSVLSNGCVNRMVQPVR